MSVDAVEMFLLYYCQYCSYCVVLLYRFVISKCLSTQDLQPPVATDVVATGAEEDKVYVGQVMLYHTKQQSLAILTIFSLFL